MVSIVVILPPITIAVKIGGTQITEGKKKSSPPSLEEIIFKAITDTISLGGMSAAPDVTQRIQSEVQRLLGIFLSKQEIHNKLLELYYRKKLDMQPGKGKDSIIAPDKYTFQWIRRR